ncbi:hypothetical protein [Mangrovibacter phragmitis]|uniref:hypothetical protein n=1 Tax=Mangrovibacter phragmitis TaxID=1691903 RepID=UPI00336A8B64
MTNFICIASGPSLSRKDCLLSAKSGLPIIAVNSSWQIIPECQYIFAGDYAWWDKHHDNITSHAEKWTTSPRAKILYGVNLFGGHTEGAFNSGQMAIRLASHFGAKRIILLGYDCSLKNGIHWHGKHHGLDNPSREEVSRWHTDFSSLVCELPDVEIINASRYTELTCFPVTKPESIFNAC